MLLKKKSRGGTPLTLPSDGQVLKDGTSFIHKCFIHTIYSMWKTRHKRPIATNARSRKTKSNTWSKIKTKTKSKTWSKPISSIINVQTEPPDDHKDPFLKEFPYNVDKINRAIALYSGKYAIEPNEAQKFIQSQHLPIYRQAASDLIENTHYITLQHIVDIMETVIQKMYKEIHRIHPYGEPIRIGLFVGSVQKSQYFMSVIALMNIRKLGLTEPIAFYPSFSHAIFKEAVEENRYIFIIDDASYSGSQMGNQLKEIYKIYSPRIIVGVAITNTVSQHILTTSGPSTHLTIVSGQILPSLVESIGLERYVALTRAFSPYVQPICSLYLDHKIADDTSTFKLALRYGPIVPISFMEWTRVNDIFRDPDHNVYPHIERIMHSYYEQNKQYPEFKRKWELRIFHILALNIVERIRKNINQTIQSEIEQLPSGMIANERELSFVPFLRQCNHSKLIQSVIRYAIQNGISYNAFMAPEQCLRELKNPPDEYLFSCNTMRGEMGIGLDSDELVADFLKGSNRKNKPISVSTAISFSDIVHNSECPSNWYKSGALRMK